MQTQAITLEYICKLVGLFLGIVLPLLGVIGVFVKMLHNDMKKSIQVIHDDLKPLILDVAQVKIEIINIKDDHKELKEYVHEQDKWLRNNDSRLQAIERHPILKSA